MSVDVVAGFLIGFLLGFGGLAIYLGWRTADWLWRKRKYRNCRYCKEGW